MAQQLPPSWERILPAAGTRSADGLWVSNGTEWVWSPPPIGTHSDNGAWYWDGSSWRPTYHGHGAAKSSAALLVILAVVAACYIGLHAVRYRNCIFTPGIFDWPSQCL